MIDLKTVERLAELSRITVSDEEKGRLVKDLESILGYVDQIKTAVGEGGPKVVGTEEGQINILREDDNYHDRGQFTEVLLACSPEKEGGYIKVKKIL